MTNNKLRGILAASIMVATFTFCAMTAGAQTTQTSEVKEKPPMYSYVANWTIPRAQWAELAKENAATQAILNKALADGTLVGYGFDENLVHSAEGETHDSWWSSMSMAGLMNILDQFYKNGSATTPVLASATKHWDEIYVSRYYNWHPGPIQGGYTYVAFYRLKPTAPDDGLDTLSKNIVVPLLERMLANGTISEYEIDTEAVHTDAPGGFAIIYLAPKAEGLDTVNKAIRDAVKANALVGPSFDSMVDFSKHRDELVRTNATYK